MNSGNQLRRQQRVATELEEIVAQADTLDFQHIGPDRRHLLLLLCGRRDVLALQLAGVRFRQCLAIELAVGAQRHPVEDDEVRGHHVIRQRLLEEGLERITQLIVVVLDHQIRRQLFAGRAVNVDHHRLMNTVVLQQAGFDFAQLDPQAANLYLMVDTPGIVDNARVAITRQIASAVQPAAALFVERIRHEALSRQGCSVVITPRQTDAAQVQLRRHALCSRQQAVVEDVGFQVVDRSPDRHAEDVIRAASPMGHVDGGFGGAIQVVQAGLRQPL